MLYRQKFNTYIRCYGDIGYIANKSDFSDRVVDAAGAIFLAVLSRKSQGLDDIAAKIALSFLEVDIEALKKDFTPIIRRADKITLDFLDEHFKNNPRLTSFQIELTNRCNERCVHCYIPHELSSVQVSLYSMKPERHDAITALPGSFEKTKSSILRLIENDIPLQISCPVMKQNKNCYKDVLNWAYEHKCRAITDYVMMARFDNTTDNLNHRLSFAEVETLIRNII